MHYKYYFPLSIPPSVWMRSAVELTLQRSTINGVTMYTVRIGHLPNQIMSTQGEIRSSDIIMHYSWFIWKYSKEFMASRDRWQPRSKNLCWTKDGFFVAVCLQKPTFLLQTRGNHIWSITYFLNRGLIWRLPFLLLLGWHEREWHLGSWSLRSPKPNDNIGKMWCGRARDKGLSLQSAHSFVCSQIGSRPNWMEAFINI